MSRASAQVYRDGKLVALGIFNGTVDVMCGRLFRRCADAWTAYYDGKTDMFPKCNCGGEWVDVVVYTNYGYGDWWKARACLSCMTLTDGWDAYPGDGGAPNSGEPPFYVNQWEIPEGEWMGKKEEGA